MMDGSVDGRMEDGWTHERTNGWTDGRKDGPLDGWTERQTAQKNPSGFSLKVSLSLRETYIKGVLASLRFLSPL